MGTAHILYLYGDALDNAGREALAAELGRAVLALTLQPDGTGVGPQRITWHRVGSHGNALQWCGEVHSRENRVYLWSANCLRDLRDLPDEGLALVRDALDRERARRSGRRS